MHRSVVLMMVTFVALVSLIAGGLWWWLRPDPHQEQVFTLAAPVTSVAISPDNQWVAAGAQDGSVTLWNHATGEQVWQQRGLNGRVLGLAFRPDNQHLVAGDDSGQLLLFNLATCTTLTTMVPITTSGTYVVEQGALTRVDDGIIRLTYLRRVPLLMLTSYTRDIMLLDPETLAIRQRWQAHTNGTDFTLTPSEAWLVTWGVWEYISIWALPAGTEYTTYNAAIAGRGNYAVLTSDERRLVTVVNNRLAVWSFPDITALHPAQSFAASRDYIPAYASDPTVTWIARSGGRNPLFVIPWPNTGADPAIYIHPIAHPNQIATTLRGHTALVQALVYSNDGQYLVSGSDDQTVRVWRVGE